MIRGYKKISNFNLEVGYDIICKYEQINSKVIYNFSFNFMEGKTVTSFKKILRK